MASIAVGSRYIRLLGRCGNSTVSWRWGEPEPRFRRCTRNSEWALLLRGCAPGLLCVLRVSTMRRLAGAHQIIEFLLLLGVQKRTNSRMLRILSNFQLV